MLSQTKQEIRANAHETRDSISAISYAGCLGRSQVISAKIHAKCALQPHIANNSLKTDISGVEGRSRSSMLVPPKNSSPVLVMKCSKFVSICSRSRARLVDSSRNRAFWRGIQMWCIRTKDSLNAGGPNLYCLNLRLMQKISFAGCLGLWPVISTQLTIDMCVKASTREKFTKHRYFGVQGRSRSSMLVSPESSSAVLVMMSSKSLSICNRSLARLDDSSTVAETARFEGGT